MEGEITGQAHETLMIIYLTLVKGRDDLYLKNFQHKKFRKAQPCSVAF
jgi:hypothetical protein